MNDALEPSRATRIPVSLRIDPEVIDWFKSGGKNWQTHMNNVLRSYVRTNIHVKSDT